MIQVILSLAAGFIISYVCNFSDRFYKYLGKITTFGLIFLLFIMGIQIGVNEKVMANLPTLGLKSFILAGGAILGSLSLVILLEKVTIIDSQNKEREIEE
ncbi:MAG TPA: lysine exporter LysO family protein [Clostridia bacterium]|nr:lysine exporter LysO family protein [Clostridia bacterium]